MSLRLVVAAGDAHSWVTKYIFFLFSDSHRNVNFSALYLLLPPLADHIYYFEGRDYSKDPCCEDHSRFEQMVKEQLEEVQRSSGEGRTLRHKAGVRFTESRGAVLHPHLQFTKFPVLLQVSLLSLAIPVKKRKLLTSAAENEQHWRKMEEAVPKRRRTQEETKKKKKRAELKFQKK